MLYENGLQRQIRRRRYTRQQPGTKSGRRPGDKPRINRLSTAGFVPASVYIGFPLFVLPETHPGSHSSIVWRVRGTVFSFANSPVGVLCCPSPPGPAVLPCAAPYRPARGISGFWIRQVDRMLRRPMLHCVETGCFPSRARKRFPNFLG